MAKTKKREDLGQTKKEIQVRMDFLNVIEDMSLEQIADATLTNFKKKGKSTPNQPSTYYSLHTYTLRFSNHLSKNSPGNIQFVTLENKILMWKIGLNVDSNPESMQGEFGYMLKTITKTELFDILTLINNIAKYFIP